LLALSRLPTQDRRIFPYTNIYTRKNIRTHYYISTQQEKVSEHNIISTQVSTHQMRTSKIILFLYKILHKVMRTLSREHLEYKTLCTKRSTILHENRKLHEREKD
jgi:hypothetical protein